MANTYSQIHIQAVFAVKGRQSLLLDPFRQRVFRYMNGVLNRRTQKGIIVNGAADHVHVFFSMRPITYIPKLISELKTSTTKFINDSNLTSNRFSWQEGYGVFAYSRSHVDSVYQYILNQEKRHRNQSFREEYIQMLKDNDVAYDEWYLFDFLDE